MSVATAKILLAFLEEPTREQYGFGLMRATKVKSGSLYPILERLERLGWIAVQEEQIDARVKGRPRRRLYRLTAVGQTEATEAVRVFYDGLKMPLARLQWPKGIS